MCEIVGRARELIMQAMQEFFATSHLSQCSSKLLSTEDLHCMHESLHVMDEINTARVL